ncbi:MAG: nitronate monooxygenase [Chloroflexi bacterium]|nr:nitronate monooxygenase [Chloroflexota bacterium]
MRTRICETLGLEFPIFAFSHCRDVVAAVSRAGGMGVLGALAYTPAQLEVELRWIDEHVDGKPYGVDVVMPASYTANALGPPPKDVIEKAHAKGVPVAALVGTADQARAQAEAGVDIIVAQGSEAGGHTGEISTLVLVPEVVEAVRPAPVLAAGGIGSGRQMAAALALGADGVWTGSIWLTVKESDTNPVVVNKLLKASSRDTVRSRALTGKPARQLRTSWTQAWDSSDSPGALPMPLQFLLTAEAVHRIHRYAHVEDSQAKELVGSPVGQIVGRMNAVRPSREVIYDMVQEFVDTVNRLTELLRVADETT